MFRSKNHIVGLGPGPIDQIGQKTFIIVGLTALVLTGGCRAGKATHATPATSEGGHRAADQTTTIAPLLVSEVDRGSIPPVSFQISNTKQQPMTVELVEKSCGCQSVELPEHPVPADDVAEIRMLIDPPRKADSKAYWATLTLGWGMEKETVKLRAELDVLPDLLSTPPDLSHDFASESVRELMMAVKQRVRSDEEPAVTQPEFYDLPEEVEVVGWEHAETRELCKAEGRGEKSEDRGQGSVSSADAQRSTLDAQRLPIWEIDWRATLRLKVTDRVRQSPEGFVRQCVVACGDGEFQRLQIPIQLRCVDAIQASPTHTYFGRVKAGEERQRIVLLRSRDEEFEISELVCESSWFAAKATTREAKRLHIIQVIFANAATGQHNGKVRVLTTHPKCPEVSLTVEGSVEGGGQLSVGSGQ